MRIFLDANILFSAAKSEGFVRRLLDLLVADGHTLCADVYVAEEARRNLATKGASGLPALPARPYRIEVAPIYTDPTTVAAAAALPEKDRPVLAAAARLGCQALVTGDRTHFGRFLQPQIGRGCHPSPRSLAELLL